MHDNNELLMSNKTENTPTLRKYGWGIHIIAWGILCGFPIIMSISNSSDQTISWDKYVRFFIMLSSLMIVFYTNYLFFVKRFLFTRKTGLFILINIGLIIGIILLVHFCMELLPEPPLKPDRPPREGAYIGFLFWNSMVYVFTIVLSVAFRSTASWYKTEAERKDLERSRSEAELQNLKSQLNPHFLFNTLNNIYSLIAFSPEKAQEAVHDLSRLLRYVLYDSNQPFVPVEKDLDFVRNYVELMRIRLPEHVKLETDISALTPDTLISPLLFISLVENAFKHGVSNSKPSFIDLDIHQEGHDLICTIINSDFPKDVETDKSGSGIGLVNLQKRLELLYPGQYQFRCGKEGGNYCSYLAINLNKDAE